METLAAKLLSNRLYSNGVHRASQERAVSEKETVDADIDTNEHSQDAEILMEAEMEISLFETPEGSLHRSNSRADVEDDTRSSSAFVDELESEQESQEYDELVDEEYEEVSNYYKGIGKSSSPYFEDEHEIISRAEHSLESVRVLSMDDEGGRGRDPTIYTLSSSLPVQSSSESLYPPPKFQSQPLPEDVIRQLLQLPTSSSPPPENIVLPPSSSPQWEGTNAFVGGTDAISTEGVASDIPPSSSQTDGQSLPDEISSDSVYQSVADSTLVEFPEDKQAAYVYDEVAYLSLPDIIDDEATELQAGLPPVSVDTKIPLENSESQEGRITRNLQEMPDYGLKVSNGSAENSHSGSSQENQHSEIPSTITLTPSAPLSAASEQSIDKQEVAYTVSQESHLEECIERPSDVPSDGVYRAEALIEAICEDATDLGGVPGFNTSIKQLNDGEHVEKLTEKRPLLQSVETAAIFEDPIDKVTEETTIHSECPETSTQLSPGSEGSDAKDHDSLRKSNKTTSTSKKRSHSEVDSHTYKAPALKRMTPTLAKRQHAKLSAPFRSPLIGITQKQKPTETEKPKMPKLRPFPLLFETKRSSPSEEKSTLSNRTTQPTILSRTPQSSFSPSGSSRGALLNSSLKATTQFKSPLMSKSVAPSALGVNSSRATQALERKLQTLKRAIKITQDGEEERLAELVQKWKNAGREVAWDLWHIVREQTTDENTGAAYPGTNAKSVSHDASSSNWGWASNLDSRNSSLFGNSWGFDKQQELGDNDDGGSEGFPSPSKLESELFRALKQNPTSRVLPTHRSPNYSTNVEEHDHKATSIGPDDGDEEHGAGESKSLGTMLRHFGIAHETLGWNEDEGDFLED